MLMTAQPSSAHSQLETAKALKVAYLTSVYPALSHTFILREIDAMEARGHEVHRLSVRKPGNPQSLGEREQQEMQTTTYLLASLKSLSAVGTIAGYGISHPKAAFKMLGRAFTAFRKNPAKPIQAVAYLFEAIWLAAWLRARGITHVHNHFGNAAGTVAWIAAADETIDFSLSIHGPDIFYEVEAAALPEKLADATFTRAISHFCRSQLCLYTDPTTWDKMHIVRCGVNPQTFAPRPHPGNTRPRVLCVGRLVPAKGQHILVDASLKLKAQGVDHELVLIGAGPDLDNLQRIVDENQAGDWITLTGGCPQEQVRKLYQTANLLVLPSFAEGIPVVLMEAMASEIPVISTPVAGISELIRHEKTGLMAQPSSVENLALQIRTFLHNPEFAEACGKAGRNTILDLYNLDINGPQMANLFEKYLTR